MEYNKELLAKLRLYTQFKERNVVYEEVAVQEVSFCNLRDRLIGLGTILEEDFDTHIYVISIMAGVGNANSAVVAIKLTHEKLLLAGYAKEGLINQHTANKAIDKVLEKMEKGS